jgi:hypothetical protein
MPTEGYGRERNPRYLTGQGYSQLDASVPRSLQGIYPVVVSKTADGHYAVGLAETGPRGGGVGGGMQIWKVDTEADFAGLTGPTAGDLGYTRDTHIWYGYDGTGWLRISHFDEA